MKKLVVILASALLVAGIVGTRLWLQLRDERAQNTALEARVSAIEARAAAFRPAAPAAAAPAATLAGPPATGAPEPARPARTPQTAALIAGVREMMTSPEGKEMRRNALRMRLPQQYPDLGKELGLSPEEVNKFFDLLARQQSDLTDGVLSLATGGARDPAAVQEMQRKAQATRQANDAELAASLGSKYPQWQQYQETLPTRQQVNQLQTMLGSSGTPLSDAQAKPLIAALAAEQNRINQEARNAPPAARPGNVQDFIAQREQRTADNNRRMLDAAATHLNTQQLDSYKKMLDQQQNVTRMISRLGARGAAQGQAPASAAPGP